MAAICQCGSRAFSNTSCMSMSFLFPLIPLIFGAESHFDWAKVHLMRGIKEGFGWHKICKQFGPRLDDSLV